MGLQPAVSGRRKERRITETISLSLLFLDSSAFQAGTLGRNNITALATPLDILRTEYPPYEYSVQQEGRTGGRASKRDSLRCTFKGSLSIIPPTKDDDLPENIPAEAAILRPSVNKAKTLPCGLREYRLRTYCGVHTEYETRLWRYVCVCKYLCM